MLELFLKGLCEGTRMDTDEADERGFFYGHEGSNYFEKMV
jgi:hypothetical protein